jgi:hypothetical protein
MDQGAYRARNPAGIGNALTVGEAGNAAQIGKLSKKKSDVVDKSKPAARFVARCLPH